MTTVTSPLSVYPGTARNLMRYLSDVFEGIREGRDMQIAYNELARLSDKELSGRGLTREDIPTAAASYRTAA